MSNQNIERCPTCGAAVSIGGNPLGTWYYIPTDDQRSEDLEHQLAERDAMLAEQASMLELEISAIESDERFHYKPARVDVNAPLALIQVDLGARHKLAKKLLDSLPATAQANAKIIAAAEEQERIQSQMGDYPDEISREYVLACGVTNEAVREKKELLKP